MQTIKHPGMRKAAIFVASLEQAAADALLDHVGPERARELRQAMVDLGDIDPKEQRRVIDEFSCVGPMKSQQPTPGVELADTLAAEFDAEESGAKQPGEPDAPPFRFLQEAETDKLSRLLAGERPQTVALVLAHLPPRQAGTVLARLRAEERVEVIRRLVELEETDSEILREVEQALQARLSQQVCMQRRRVAGLQAVSGILEASDGQVSAQILDSLVAHDRPLAERLGPPPLRFEELTHLGDAALGKLLEAAGLELTEAALLGAPPSLVDRVVLRLSPGQAAWLRRKLAHPRPFRLSDVEEARQRIAELARHLLMTGRIAAPHSREEALFVA